MVEAARLAARRTGDRGRFAIIILALPDLGMDWGVTDQGFDSRLQSALQAAAERQQANGGGNGCSW